MLTIEIKIEAAGDKFMGSAYGRGAFLCAELADTAVEAAKAAQKEAKAFFPESEIEWLGLPAEAVELAPAPVLSAAEAEAEVDALEHEVVALEEAVEEKPKAKPAKKKAVKVLGEA